METATTGQVYVADGLASGAWTTVTGLSFTGMVAPFTTPIVPSGWYELNGATISDSTDPALYNVMTIQGNGSRLSGAALITGLTSTTNMKVGYYVYGTGINAGTTILTIDSATDLTMSANATSSGTSNVIVSPWQLTAGGIVLPDLTTAGRYLRSRTSSFRMGLTQATQNKSHTHAFSTNTDGGGTTGNNDISHKHTYLKTTVGTLPINAVVGSGGNSISTAVTADTSTDTVPHTHTFPNHSHAGTTTADVVTLTESRPETLVIMWCIKR